MITRAYWGTLATVLCVGVCLAGVLGAGTVAAAEEFRVENRVYFDDDEEPRVQSTTVFFAGVVYDYLKEPAEVTVFDKARGRFVLLDLTRRIKTELATEKVEAFAERLKVWAGTQDDPFLHFLADPQFDENLDGTAGEMAFASPWMTYRLMTVDAQSEEISGQYREFSDWHSRLNTMINLGARPPFARMIVNAALDDHGRLPREVSLTFRPKEGFLAQQIKVRSEHQLVRRLVESDRDRVTQTDQFMAIFQPVSFQEYQEKMAQ